MYACRPQDLSLPSLIIRETPRSPHYSRRPGVDFELRHPPAEGPAALPPSSRTRCRLVAALAGAAVLRVYSTGVSTSTLQPRAAAARYRTVAPAASPPLRPRAVAARHRAVHVAASASPPRPPRAVAAHHSASFSSSPPQLGLRRDLASSR